MIEINRIYNKNCISGMKDIDDGVVDLVLTDPPYNISRQSTYVNGGMDRFHYSIDFGEWDKNTFDLKEFITQSYRVLRDGGYIICFHDVWKITEVKNLLEEAGFTQIRLIEWIKTNPVPINSHSNYLTNTREIAVCGVKGSKCTFNSDYDNGIYYHEICHDKGRFHPTQKPEKLITELILKHSNENDLVLDGCMGSGTTAVACIKNKRNYIGFEIDDVYYEKCMMRVNNVQEIEDERPEALF